ncbi:MAG: S8 family serine peptidase, partial [Anaerolineae bacterium]|nr:S8 family serine peptidase [Phycisphaerae bacterium]
NDTSFGTMWGMHNTGQSGGTVDADIDAPEAWDITRGSSDVVVGMVDSGINLAHTDINDNIWVNPFEIAGNGIDDEGNGFIDDINGWDFWGNAVGDGVGDSNPTDQNGHGTHTGGTVGAEGNNSSAVTGVNQAVKMMVMKIGGSGSSVSLADAVSSMNYLADMRNRGVNIRVSNHSWGGGGFSASMNTAIANHAALGIVFVAAAGNGGADLVGDNNDTTPFYPASYAQPNVISVGNHTRTSTRATSSNFGLTSVDLFAPGTAILSTSLAGGTVSFDGTSMASPHVAGAVAMGFNVHTGSDYATVRNAVLAGVDPVAGFAANSVTGGRLNVNNMLERLVFNLNAGVLTVTGTISADKIVLNFDGVNVSATVGPTSGATSRTKTYPLATVTSIVVNGGNSADTIEITNTRPATPLTVNGGAGTDTISIIETHATSPVTIAPSADNDIVQVNATGVGTAQAIFGAIHLLGSLSIASGGLATMALNGSNVLRTNALSLTGTGTLDMTNNDLIVDYSGGTQLPAVQALINSARASGAWTGSGITSSAAKNASPANTSLAAIEASDFDALYGAAAPFSGQSVDATAVLVKYTYYGDTDFNGVVDFDDYSRADAGFNNNRTGWLNGDADGNGIVDFDDYSLIDLAFNTQVGTL